MNIVKGIIYELKRIADAIEAILVALLRAPQGNGHTNIHITEVQINCHKENPMPPVDHMPDFILPSSSVRASLSVVGPKLSDFATSGKYAVSPTWKSSDETTVSLEAIPDSVALGPDGNPLTDENGNQIPVYSTFANTPLTPDPGTAVSATVTWSATGMADCDIKIVYGDPAVGHAAITSSQVAEA
jgi:hypothetical protein